MSALVDVEVPLEETASAWTRIGVESSIGKSVSFRAGYAVEAPAGLERQQWVSGGIGILVRKVRMDFTRAGIGRVVGERTMLEVGVEW